MKLLLIRHALPVRREMAVGTPGPELLSSEHLGAIYASPLGRAYHPGLPTGLFQESC